MLTVDILRNTREKMKQVQSTLYEIKYLNEQMASLKFQIKSREKKLSELIKKHNKENPSNQVDDDGIAL